ncbi:hypothetical protein D9756_003364 [Leucocoprinus leucothites]|uniref:Uncharacterized protein n=1 Tax=Leucocoprinus leucothites TaxID=201217 RepID=A0A8H5LJS4_9AGAR|nr:hypothetical protein D9756_003364 [Leucoagaricus leucothites]
MSETSFQPFLGNEWLVKTNSGSSTPYLFIPNRSGAKQIARRWRQCNPRAPSPSASVEDETKWRISILELLAKAHTLGGVNALSFEVVQTNYSVRPPSSARFPDLTLAPLQDIAFSLESTSFSWRWETCFVGYKLSADTISKQLVLPLISTNHLLFTSPEPIQVMTDTDVEKVYLALCTCLLYWTNRIAQTVDKIGRTARRSLDTHIKNSLSKPRVSTILRRMTAIFNSLHEPRESLTAPFDKLANYPFLPLFAANIISSVEEPNLQVPSAPTSKPAYDDFTSTKDQHENIFTRDVVSSIFAQNNNPFQIEPQQEMSEPPRAHRFRSPMRVSPPPQRASKPGFSPAKAGSATEESSEDEGGRASSLAPPAIASQSQANRNPTPKHLTSPKFLQPSASPNARSKSPLAEPSRSTFVHAKTPEQAEKTSDDDSSPVKLPQKKVKAAHLSSSDSDSEAERRAQLKFNTTGAGAAKRGVRQPIKRGGKRF